MPTTFWREKAEEYLRLAKTNPAMTALAAACFAAVSEAEAASANMEVPVTGERSASRAAISPNDSRFRTKTVRAKKSVPAL
jgi:hypothetical protein